MFNKSEGEKMKELSKTIIILSWHDCCKHGYETLHEDDCQDLHPMKLISTGVLITETEADITLGNDYCEEYKNYRDVVVYPMSGIIDIKRVKVTTSVIGKMIIDITPICGEYPNIG